MPPPAQTEAGARKHQARSGRASAISQAVRACALRPPRYGGLTQIHREAGARAAAVNGCRDGDDLTGAGFQATRISAFATLAARRFR
jgi:hypothetical protein